MGTYTGALEYFRFDMDANTIIKRKNFSEILPKSEILIQHGYLYKSSTVF